MTARRLQIWFVGLMLSLLVGAAMMPQPAVAQPDIAVDVDDKSMAPQKPPEEATDAETDGPVVPTAEEPSELTKKFNTVIGGINKVVAGVLFRSVTGDAIQVGVVDESGEPVIDPATGEQQTKTVPVPFMVVVLFAGGLFFTFFYRFINVRGFRHSLQIVRGKFDNPEDAGEISHFRALTSALSATIGLGNIAGVAIAIQLGGPGAVFWMLIAAFFGMSMKFSSCTLAQLYRRTNPDGSISGGPMYYLDIALAKKGGLYKPIGKILAVMFAFMVMGGALGGGNMFQANQSFEAVSSAFSLDASYNKVFGVILAVLVGLVIVGGIKRIGAATSRIVPSMVAIYVLASLFVIITNISQVPASLALIFKMAFSENAAYGGAVGVMVWGIKRASFSNEAGLGSSAIAHAAARTKEPVREGLVAMMEPFVDTIIVCLMTAVVVIVSGAWNDPRIPQEAGVALTSAAFGTVISWFPYVLSICVVLFAYSTMISWSYYGERGWIYLLDHFGGRGLQTVIVFRIIFVCFVFIGSVTQLDEVLGFSDLLILCMAFPNIIGSILIAPQVKKITDDYWARYTSGRMHEGRNRVLDPG